MTQRGSDSPVNLVYYGSPEPLPERRLVRAGPISAILEGADLRYVAVGSEVVILRLYAAIRDQSWGTIAPVFTEYHLEQDETSFALRFTAEHVSSGEQGVDFAWTGSIVGSREGTIVCEMDGVARSPFLRNRIGWCVLHPMELAGRAVEIHHDDSVEQSRFPERISPHQPFFEIEQVVHEVSGGGRVRIVFAGDVFETEDQRNWTDASYKTYSTPLSIPYPVALAAGDRVRQSVTVTVEGVRRAVAWPAPGEQLAIRVGSELGPELPAIGLGTAGHGEPMSEAEIDRFRSMSLKHLHHVVDLAKADWQPRLAQAATGAASIGAQLRLEVLTNDDGQDIGDLVAALPRLEPDVAGVTVFPRSNTVSTNQVLAAAQSARDGAGLSFPIGGGSRAYFTQLNRNVPDPNLLDFVAFGLNPQVHAFDNASIVETLAAQGETVNSAKEIAGSVPVAVGPITLRPRINPDAVPTTAATASGTLPDTVDVRQPSLFAGGWTAGSIRHLAEAAPAAVTYYETTGWRGVIERSDHELRVPQFPSRPGIAFPVYHILADAGEFAGGRLLPVDISDQFTVEALALVLGDRVRVVVASFSDREIVVGVSLPRVSELRVRTLDETTYDRAADSPEAFRADFELLPEDVPDLSMTLRPFAVVTIDGLLVAD